MGLLDDLERERELEKIRGKPAKKPREAMLKPLPLGSYGVLHPLDDDPAEWKHDPRRFPKRIRQRYVHAIALISRAGNYIGALTSDKHGDFFLWRPGKFGAGSAGSTLWEVIERDLVPTQFLDPALKAKVDKLEAQYREEQIDRSAHIYR